MREWFVLRSEDGWKNFGRGRKQANPENKAKDTVKEPSKEVPKETKEAKNEAPKEPPKQTETPKVPPRKVPRETGLGGVGGKPKPGPGKSFDWKSL